MMPRRGTIPTVLGCRGREAAAVGAGVDQPLSTDHRLGASSAGKPVIDNATTSMAMFQETDFKSDSIDERPAGTTTSNRKFWFQAETFFCERFLSVFFLSNHYHPFCREIDGGSRMLT